VADDVAHDVAKHLRLHTNCSMPGAFQRTVVTAGRRRGARALPRVPGCARAGVRRLSVRRTRKRRRGGRNLAGVPSTGSICAGKNDFKVGKPKQEARREERKSRGCATSPRSSTCRRRCRRRKELAAIDENVDGDGEGERRICARCGAPWFNSLQQEMEDIMAVLLVALA
jgi:hypothetical protein